MHERVRASWPTLLGILAVGGVTAWLALTLTGDHRDRALDEADLVPTAVEFADAPRSPADEGAVAPLPVETGVERMEPSPDGGWVRVLDADRDPVLEGTFSITASGEDRAAGVWTATALDAGERWSGGRFLLRDSDRSGDVTLGAPAHRVVARTGETLAGEVLLDAADPILVEVRDEDGRLVPEAEVALFAELRAGIRHVAHVQRAKTDLDGRAQLLAVDADVAWLQARSDQRASRSVLVERARATGTAPVSLVLQSVYEVRGRVRGAPGAAALESARVVLRHEPTPDLWNESERTRRGVQRTASVGADGEFSLTDVPRLSPGRSWIRLDAVGCVPVDRPIELPGPDGVAVVDLEWSSGHAVDFHVEDEDGAPQAGALVVAAWRDGGGPRWSRASSRAREDGVAPFTALPAARHFVRVSGEGLASAAHGPYDVPAASGPFTIVVEPAGRVVGRCVRAGEDGGPAEDFEVTFWGEDPTGRFSETFTGAVDGRFELTSVPRGALHLFASDTAGRRSAEVTIQVDDETAQEVVLELVDGVPATGRVVDATTGSPIVGADVQVFSYHRLRVLDPLGPSVSTGADGRFEGLLLSAEGTILSVRAEGHADRFVQRQPASSAEVDFGLVPLVPEQDVVIELVAPGPVPFTEYSAVLDALGPEVFDAEGQVRFEGVPAQYGFLQVYTPTGGRIDVDLEVRAGFEGPYRVAVGSGRSLTIRVAPAERRTEAAWLAASYRDLTGEITRALSRFEEGGVAQLDQVPGDRVQLQALDAQGVALATAWKVVAGDASELELRLDGAERFYEFVLAGGEPVRDATIVLLDAEDPARAPVRLTADSEGHLELRSVEGEALLFQAILDGERRTGFRPLPVGEASREEPLRVVLDLSSEVAVRLEERGVPAAAVAVDLLEGGEYVHQGFSDEGGRVRLGPVSRGAYELRVTSPVHWSSTHAVVAHAANTAEEAVLEVRRKGDLRLRILDSGLAVSGLPVQLEYEEASALSLAADVGGWLEEGLLFEAPAALETDTAGELHLKGLPSGAYRWSFARDGEPQTGTLVVLPLDEARVDVHL